MAEMEQIDVTETEKVEAENPAVDYAAEIERLKDENRKLREANTNASADASRYKKALRERMTEQEQKDAEQAERIAKMQAENEAFRNRERTLNYKTKLMESGYSADVAANLAASLPDGISDDFFTEQKRYIEDVRAKERADALNSQPAISVGKTVGSEMIEDAQMAAFRKAVGLRN